MRAPSAQLARTATGTIREAIAWQELLSGHGSCARPSVSHTNVDALLPSDIGCAISSEAAVWLMTHFAHQRLPHLDALQAVLTVRTVAGFQRRHFDRLPPPLTEREHESSRHMYLRVLRCHLERKLAAASRSGGPGLQCRVAM